MDVKEIDRMINSIINLLFRSQRFEGTIMIHDGDYHSHNLFGPAVIKKSGQKEWWVNGQLHREDGPAVIWPSGKKEWFFKGQLHRLDGPAVIDENGEEEYWEHGERMHDPEARERVKIKRAKRLAEMKKDGAP